MADSDDYGFDDLDEQTLALLEQEEKKYQSSLVAPPPAPEGPVTKRHKIDKGWAPGIGAAHAQRDDYDDLPEISVQGDGTYGVGSLRPKSNPVSAQPPNYRRSTSSTNVAPAGSSSSATRYANKQPPRTSYPHDHVASRSKPAPQNGYPQQRNVEQPSNGQNGMNPANSSKFEKEMQELQAKLEQMRQENAKIQADLQAAIDVKLKKEGEVSVLRKTIEKNSQNHAIQVAQLKAEKEKADVKQIQLQRELKEETERLRTQFLFKQQELEAASRKPPASVRAKKTGRDFPSTPLAVPSVMRNWNKESSQASTSRRSIDETPLRPARPPPPIFKASPTKDIRKSPEKSRKSSLPGFQNAFEMSTPMRSPSKRNKGKANMEPAIAANVAEDFSPFPRQMPAPDPPPVSQPFPPSQASQLPTSSNATSFYESETPDEPMDIVTQESEDDGVLEEDPLNPINWKAELCRIILTHSHSSIDQISFQYLLGPSNAVENVKAYCASCGNILAVLATSTRANDYAESLGTVAKDLLVLLAGVVQSHRLMPIVILLDLLNKLVLSLPDFRRILLTARVGLDAEENQTMMDIIQRIIAEHLTPDKTTGQPDTLGIEVLAILETFCFSPTSETVEQLQCLAENRDIPMILLHPAHPPWFLERSTRFFVFLTTHHDLWEALLGPSTDDGLKNSLIDRLCSLIVDMTKSSTDICKIYILIFFAQLSIAHDDAHTALIASYSLIPSLILYTSQLIAPIWEDDWLASSLGEECSSLIQMINQTLFLLYQLIFGTNPCVNLRYKIQQAPPRAFNSLLHIFTVTFGRLSYCDPPSWMDSDSHHQLESIAEIARDILELVFDGPEGDSVWAAFQSEQDEESAEDEEELEARLMGVDA